MSAGTLDMPSADSGTAEAPRREFLTFRLGDEDYGVDILQVQEIRGVEVVTRVPRVAPFVRGVINLRGAIVPIVDLGLMFGFPEALAFDKASAIILDVKRRQVGLLVASVSDVASYAESEILPTPELGDRAVARALTGIGVHPGESKSVLLLDVPHILRRIREERE